MFRIGLWWIVGLWMLCVTQDVQAQETCQDGAREACYQGPQATLGRGGCRAGTRICEGGLWGRCLGQILPAAEDWCGDEIDNDCDGVIDEGCPRPPDGSAITEGTTEPISPDAGQGNPLQFQPRGFGCEIHHPADALFGALLVLGFFLLLGFYRLRFRFLSSLTSKNGR